MKHKISFSLILLFVLVFINSSFSLRLFRGRPVNKHGLLAVPESTTVADVDSERWFIQRLDHFDPTNLKTWKQRYFTNIDDFKNLGDNPIFLQLGGEGEASPIWLKRGQIAENYAKKYNAAQVLFEHRYYGESQPTKDMSVDNLKYLTSEQALQDAANFISFFKSKHGLYKNKWIVFGGSYSGSLAAWFRLKYPHLVEGAVASSAPVQAVLDFKEYVKVVEDSLGESCVREISHATNEVIELLKTKSGWNEIETMFNLCDKLDANVNEDVSNLFESLANNFEGVVQYNKDNRKFEGGIGQNITIDTLCSIMTNVEDGSKAVNRYAKVNQLLLDTYSTRCLDFKYQSFIDQLKDTSFNKTSVPGGRQWTYQTCTEFGFFQSSDYPNQPFGDYFSVDFFVKQCVDIFGEKFNKRFICDSIDFTNSNYGGFNLTLTNVIFPNGLIDPWHSLGILHEINESSKPLIIQSTAHCADMYPDSKDDPASLTKAREVIKKTIGEFLGKST